MKLGFIGLGIMGSAMASNLIQKSGEAVFVYDFDDSKVAAAVELGGKAAKSSLEVVEQAEVIFTSVPTAQQVFAVHASVYDAVVPGQIFVDMSTIAPADSIALGQKLQALGAQFLDVPVVKSKQQAIEGKLGIYVGGSQTAFLRIEPLLHLLGSDVVYMGASGKGITMKILHNMMVGEIQNAVNEMMLLAEKYGIDWQTFQQAIAIGGANNFYVQTKAQNIAERDFKTAFSVDNMAKDVGIAQDLANAAALNLPGVNLVQDIYQEAVAAGFGKLDFASTFEVVAKDAETTSQTQ